MGEDLTSCANRSQRNKPNTETRFGCIDRKSTLLRWTRWNNLKSEKKITSSPLYCPSNPHLRRSPYFACGNGGHNRTCQISSEPVSEPAPGAEDNPLRFTWRIALLSSSGIIPAWFHWPPKCTNKVFLLIRHAVFKVHCKFTGNKKHHEINKKIHTHSN